ncbi:MFS transporter [Rhodoferax sp. 4810]|uniref:MFS transporter n=1 Tax=Thiospirillum jenense TaxID=1653858 RepID=A0A839HMZ5_9GAMM|nr:MFS transporter [Thiospirillum jenense]MBB1075424.1 MFS transporter [Rhodoferax jenense]MBB1126802.1 MFS transporter [Thiospirillum jenense]
MALHQRQSALEHTHDSPHGWQILLITVRDPRARTLLFLGFAAGLPLLLIFSSLSLWLREAGVDRQTVTFFSWAALGYSFKFLWAPLVDRLALPGLTRRLGRRRSWLIAAQIAIIIAMLLMAFTDPALGPRHLFTLALAAVLLGLSAATQDIVIDAYRIEIAPPAMQALLAATYIAGYRVGMIVAGAGALSLAAWFGSSSAVYSYSAWQATYCIMAAVMLIGIITTLTASEPTVATQNTAENDQFNSRHNARLVALFLITASLFATTFFLTSQVFNAFTALSESSVLIAFISEAAHFLFALLTAIMSGWLLVRYGLVQSHYARATWVAPILDFFQRYGTRPALLLLALIGLYRISDIVLGVIANVFYQDLGFSKPEIAGAVQTFGVVISLIGGFLGGLLATRFGVMRILMLGAVLSALTNLVFIGLAIAGHQLVLLYVTVSADNLAAGLASAAFIAFLSSLTNVSFTAVQYALFSSAMTLLPKLLGGYSGSIVETIGYPAFFVFTTLIGLPVLLLVWLARHIVQIKT